MGARRATSAAVAAVIGSVLLVTLLVTWAASIGPGAVLTGAGPATHRVSPSQSASPTQSGLPLDGTSQREQRAREPGDHPIVQAIALVVEVLVAALVLYLLYRWVRWLVERHRLRRRPPPPEEIDFDVLTVARRVSDEIARDATEQRDLLLGGSPRNGIVACWHRFEQQAAEAGLPRRAWETSAEFTLRMLDLVGADSHAVARFSDLYREARFSHHPLDEPARADAVAALDAIHAGLRASSGSGS